MYVHFSSGKKRNEFYLLAFIFIYIYDNFSIFYFFYSIPGLATILLEKIRMSRKFPPNLKIILSFTILFLILLITYRISFTIVFFSKFSSTSLFEIILAFLVGIRFDLSVCAILIGPFWILSTIYPLNRFRTYSLFWGISPIVLFFWVSISSNRRRSILWRNQQTFRLWRFYIFRSWILDYFQSIFCRSYNFSDYFLSANRNLTSVYHLSIYSKRIIYFWPGSKNIRVSTTSSYYPDFIFACTRWVSIQTAPCERRNDFRDLYSQSIGFKRHFYFRYGY